MTLCKVIDQPAAVVLRHMSPQVQQARVLNYIDKHVQVSANTCTAVSAELRMVTSAAGLAKALSQTLQRTMWLRKSTAWVLLFYETLLRGEGFRCSDATAALFGDRYTSSSSWNGTLLGFPISRHMSPRRRRAVAKLIWMHSAVFAGSICLQPWHSRGLRPSWFTHGAQIACRSSSDRTFRHFSCSVATCGLPHKRGVA